MGNRLIWGNRARKGLPAAELHLGRAHDAASSKKTQAGCEERLCLAPIRAQVAVSKTTHAARRDAARPVLQHKISPLSNISLRRGRTQQKSCELAHDVSKRGARDGRKKKKHGASIALQAARTCGRKYKKRKTTGRKGKEVTRPSVSRPGRDGPPAFLPRRCRHLTAIARPSDAAANRRHLLPQTCCPKNAKKLQEGAPFGC